MADIRSSQKYMNAGAYILQVVQLFFERGKNHSFLQQHNLKHVRDLKRQLYSRTTSQNLKLNVEPAVRAYTLRMEISQGQNKPLPCSHNTPQQMDHLAWRQNTFPCSSFCWTSIAHISYIAFPHLHPLSHFLWLSLHQAFRSGFFPPFPSFLLPVAPSLRVFSQEGHQ